MLMDATEQMVSLASSVWLVTLDPEGKKIDLFLGRTFLTKILFLVIPDSLVLRERRESRHKSPTPTTKRVKRVNPVSMVELVIPERLV